MSTSSSFVVRNDIDDRHHDNNKLNDNDNDINNDNDESTPATAALKQSIARAFTDLGHSAALPSSVLSSLAALISATSSSSSAFDPNRLAEAWEAYSLTRGVETLDEVTFGPFRKMLIEKVLVVPSSSSSQPPKTMAKNKVVISTTGLGKRTASGGSAGAGVTPSPAAKKGAFNTAATTNDDRLDHLTTSTSVHNSQFTYKY